MNAAAASSSSAVEETESSKGLEEADILIRRSCFCFAVDWLIDRSLVFYILFVFFFLVQNNVINKLQISPLYFLNRENGTLFDSRFFFFPTFLPEDL